MQLYLLQTHYEYSGNGYIGIFSSVDAAKQYLKDNWQHLRGADAYQINGIIVDQPTKRFFGSEADRAMTFEELVWL